MGLFFEELPTYLKDNGDLVRANEYEAYIKSEEARFVSYLYDHEASKQRIIENETDDLLYSYYDARIAVGEAAKKYGNSAPETQALRGVMNGYCSAVTLVIVRIARRAGALYSETFISEWEERAAYFPFGKVMRKARQDAEQAAPATSTGQPAAELAVQTPERRRNKGKTKKARVFELCDLMRKDRERYAKMDATVVADEIRNFMGEELDKAIKNTVTYKYVREYRQSGNSHKSNK